MALFSDALEREEPGYPPNYIEKVSADQYRIVIAVAGFDKDDMELVQDHKRLTVRGKLKEGIGKTYLHRGIATRAFERTFDLANKVEITDAKMGAWRGRPDRVHVWSVTS